MSQRAKQARMDAIYEQHFNRVAAYCLRRLPPHAANDAISETFLVAWRKLDTVPYAPGTLPFLYRVAGNVVAHQRRTFARQSRLRSKLARIAPTVPPAPDIQVLDYIEHREVRDALEYLSDSDREVIRLRAWEELTYPQIAEVLQISTAASQKRLARALVRLERALKSQGAIAAEEGQP